MWPRFDSDQMPCVGWVFLLVIALLRDLFSRFYGFPPSRKPCNISKFKFNQPLEVSLKPAKADEASPLDNEICSHHVRLLILGLDCPHAQIVDLFLSRVLELRTTPYRWPCLGSSTELGLILPPKIFSGLLVSNLKLLFVVSRTLQLVKVWRKCLGKNTISVMVSRPVRFTHSRRYGN